LAPDLAVAARSPAKFDSRAKYLRKGRSKRSRVVGRRAVKPAAVAAANNPNMLMLDRPDELS